jgi:hypothetical protein
MTATSLEGAVLRCVRATTSDSSRSPRFQKKSMAEIDVHEAEESFQISLHRRSACNSEPKVQQNSAM